MTDVQRIISNGDWREWSQWVRKGIERLEAQAAEMQKESTKLKVEMAVLKTKVALWGFIGASVATGLLNLLLFLVRHKT